METVIKSEHKIKDQLLQVMIDNEWSDMYITVWSHPAIKIWWEILRINEWIDLLTETDTFEFAQSLITEKQHESLLNEKNLDFAFSHNGRKV